MRSTHVYSPCTLQAATKDTNRIEATETPDGLDLHEALFGWDDAAIINHDIPPEYAHWGEASPSLTREGWHTLCEMYALHHPEAFARIVKRWQAWCREAVRRETHAPKSALR